MPGKRGLFAGRLRTDYTMRRYPLSIIVILILIAAASGCSAIRFEPAGVTGTPATELPRPLIATSTPLDAPTILPGTPLPTLLEAATPATTAALRRSEVSTSLPAGQFEFFGAVTVQPDFEVDGQGQNVDSIAFWEAPDPAATLMFVTAKANQLVEVWRYPFTGQEQPAISGVFGSGQVNGIVIDQESELLYVAQSEGSSTVYAFAISGAEPYWEFKDTFSGPDLGSEPNLGLLKHANGGTRLYVSDSKRGVYVWDVGPISGRGAPALVAEFSASDLESIETILADDYYQVIYIPDENGRSGVYAYQPDGTPLLRNDTNRFGSEQVFQSDEEGILLYRCLSNSGGDTGRGLIVVADQKDDLTDFEFFDRQTWEHLGSLRLEGVSNTDGIASTQQVWPDYPLGIFAAVNDDDTTIGVGWDKILTVTGLSCGDS